MKSDLKLAVLLSGSYRNIEDVWPRNKKILDSLNIPYDVYFHTWAQNPSLTSSVLDLEYQNKFYFSIFPKVYRSFPQEISENYVRDKFEFFSIQVKDFQEDQFASRFNLGTRMNNQLFQSQLNSCGMYLGIDSCARKMFRNAKYSHFLRIRPDFELDLNTLTKLFNCDLVFFGQLLPTDEGLIGDQCYGGELRKSEFILRTLEKLNEITNSPEWNVASPVVLAENVIRAALKPYRNLIKLEFFDGSGSIRRPTIQIAIHKFGFPFLFSVTKHNSEVFRKRLRRMRTKLWNYQ